jgi:dTDP-4-amino-4,6-dideoxy-D-galactose acyltransferase
MMIKRLDWDSDFCGYNVGEIEGSLIGEEILATARKSNYKLLYFKIGENDEETIAKAKVLGGFNADKKILYLQDILKLPDFDIPDFVFSFNNAVIPNDLYDLALQSGIFSRFKTDKNFINHEFERLYRIWIEKSVAGTLAKEVFVAVLNEKIEGMLTLGEKNERTDIGLFAVNQAQRGKGIGRRLFEAAVMKSKQMSVFSLQVVTQRDNKAACDFYEKIGFKKDKMEYIFHFWL